MTYIYVYVISLYFPPFPPHTFTWLHSNRYLHTVTEVVEASSEDAIMTLSSHIFILIRNKGVIKMTLPSTHSGAHFHTFNTAVRIIIAVAKVITHRVH